MRQVSPHPIWIGHAGDGRNFQQLFDLNIKAVMQLALDEPLPSAPREIIWLRIPLMDGTGNEPQHLHLAVVTLARLIATTVPTLVCCSNGMSRSPVITALALALCENVPPEDVLDRLSTTGPLDVSTTLWREAGDALKQC